MDGWGDSIAGREQTSEDEGAVGRAWVRRSALERHPEDLYNHRVCRILKSWP